MFASTHHSARCALCEHSVFLSELIIWQTHQGAVRNCESHVVLSNLGDLLGGVPWGRGVSGGTKAVRESPKPLRGAVEVGGSTPSNQAFPSSPGGSVMSTGRCGPGGRAGELRAELPPVPRPAEAEGGVPHQGPGRHGSSPAHPRSRTLSLIWVCLSAWCRARPSTMGQHPYLL